MVRWSKPKYKNSLWSTAYERTAKYKNIYASIIYNDCSNDYYFMLHKGKDLTFNSLWKYKPFSTEEACIKECEVEIERKAKEW